MNAVIGFGLQSECSLEKLSKIERIDLITIYR